MDIIPAADEAPARQRMVLWSILGFWLFYACIVSLRAIVLGFPAQGEMAARRGFVTLIGIVVTWGLYRALHLFEGRPLPVRVAVAFILAIPAATAIATVNYYAFSLYDPISLLEDGARVSHSVSAVQIIAEVAISRYFFLIAWALLYLALGYAGDVRAAERRAARFAQAAQQAELRSLRYQVNPHFLFNTLNSLSSLVLSGRSDAAEAMIMNLSDFYRATLSGDPLEDIALAEEVAMQRRYLAIEAVRFPDRLRTAFVVPPSLANARVPGLILQPLVENAIKYGVTRATRPVSVNVTARAEPAGMLTLSVTDDGPGTPPKGSGGSGIGLSNVRDRLEARYGSRAALSAGPLPGGGYAAFITIPLDDHKEEEEANGHANADRR